MIYFPCPNSTRVGPSWHSHVFLWWQKFLRERVTDGPSRVFPVVTIFDGTTESEVLFNVTSNVDNNQLLRMGCE